MNKRTTSRRFWLSLLMGLAVSLMIGLCACDNVHDDAVVSLPLLDDNGVGLYTIMRSDYSDKAITQASMDLRKALCKTYEVENWPIGTDWEQDPDDAEIAARYEILIGETNRPESAAALEQLGTDQYIICVDGNKIVIVGCDDDHTVMAVDYFIDNYIKKSDEGTTVLTLHAEVSELRTEALVSMVGPMIVETTYTTEDVVVADIYINEWDYDVDPTGEEDSTAGIQKALNDCANAGGGTVFLPVGTYRITKGISIPAFVCLRGDWQDPDTGHTYGTLILADVSSKQTTEEGLFKLGGSGGVYGLTVYYPDQSIDDPKPYPATFFVVGDVSENFMTPTVKNVTVINGYEGIRTHSVSNHEQLTVENFKGTFLSVGLYLTNSSDVGTCTNIVVSPKYWAEYAAASGDNSLTEEEICTYTRANTAGFMIGDLEWTEFIHITVTDCKYGIHIVEGERISFAGSFYDTVIMNCDVALQADDMDNRWGMQISNSYLVGSEMGIVNNSGGVIKTAGTTVKGGLQGTVLADTDNLAEYVIDTGVTYQKPAAILYTDETLDKTGKADISEKLQALLNKAGETGGVVYLPAGIYLLANPVTVPTGVELRGCSSLPNREESGMSKGTMIHVTYGLRGSAQDTAAVTLSPTSGVNGIRFQYWDNNGSLRETAYVIRGTGANVYVVNCEMMAAGRGVDFSGCDNHLIKKLTTFCYINDIRVGGKDGYVIGMLHNATVIMRHGLAGVSYPTTEGYASENHVARETDTAIIVEDAENQKIFNSFAYGVAHLIHAIDSENTLAVNVGADNIGDGSPQLLLEEGSFTGINILRYNGISCTYSEGTTVRLYSRLGINERREETLIVE